MGLIKTLDANCRDCYKCVRSCLVKAIRVKDGHAEIAEERCVYCGHCIPICPQNARRVYEQKDLVLEMLKTNQPLTISLSPSFPAAFPDLSPLQLAQKLTSVGFQRILETAEAAEALYNLQDEVQAKQPLISSYCPAVVNLIEKYYPALKENLVPIVSPLVAHARYLKRTYPEDKLVFILPCEAKKAEALAEVEIDAVLTFNELSELLKVAPTKKDSCSSIEGAASFYSRTVGISGSLRAKLGFGDYLDPRSETVSGFVECLEFLDNMQAGHIGQNTLFVEMLLCRGGCLNGSGLAQELTFEEKKEKIISFAQNAPELKPLIHLDKHDIIREFAGERVENSEPSEKEIRDILTLMGKRNKSEELDCGACGYETCHQQAIAVYRGLAEIEMCIPFLRAKAETMNDVIIQATPNGIIVVDENLDILTINPAAERMFQCKEEALKGRRVNTLIKDDLFEQVLNEKRLIVGNIEYPAYGLKVRHFVFYVPKSRVIIAIFADITEQTRQKDQLSELRKETLERAQEVINKQMRVAQEIASLLGETTAETKVTLDQLIRIIKS